MNNFDASDIEAASMFVNGLSVQLHMPAALQSRGTGKDESSQHLPPGRARKAYLVDKYPACPDSWLRSSGRIKSFFVPVIEGAGMWLDLNSCLETVPQHVAAVISIQGINAITGLPCRDAQLEQYRDQCPRHKIAFGPDRLCSKCGHRWPKQNYLSSAGTPWGNLWLDGFRSADGHVRQYVMTAQMERGVAKAVIGEDRVFALGVSFFLSKEKRPVTVAPASRGTDLSGGQFYKEHTYSYQHLSDTWQQKWTSNHDDAYLKYYSKPDMGAEDGKVTCDHFVPVGTGSSAANYNASVESLCSAASGMVMSRVSNYDRPIGGPVLQAMNVTAAVGQRKKSMPLVRAKQLEIAAGARIEQRIWDDPNDLSAYAETPEGIIVINYVSEDEAEAILAAGEVDVVGSQEGFLQAVPVGN